MLTLDPFHDAGDLDEIWSPGEYLDDVVEIRNRLLTGDVRMLYLLWLCAANDQYVSPDIIEPPVPGGLAECLGRQRPEENEIGGGVKQTKSARQNDGANPGRSG